MVKPPNDSPATPHYRNVGAPQTGTTGRTLTFTDPAPGGGQGFYRVQDAP